jgi:hypothetical protein
MSALPPKADMCSARANVRYGLHHQQLPTLDLAWLIIAVVFFMLPGALTLLALLLSELIL